MKPDSLVRWSTGLLLLAWMAGCSVLPDRPPLPTRHDFGPAAIDQPRDLWSSVIVDAPERLQDDWIRYRRLYVDPTRVDRYARSRWTAPLPELVGERLAGRGGGGGFRLRIRLLEFEQIFDRPHSARVVMGLHVQARSPAGQLMGEREFHLSLPSPTPDAPGAVAAFAGLMNQATGQLREWLAQLPSPDPVAFRDSAAGK